MSTHASHAESLPSREPGPFVPVARSAADVLAIIPHTLARWPKRSVVLLTASAHTPGPCLRVDCPEARMLGDEPAVLEWTAELSEILERDVLGDRLYLAVYTEGAQLEPQEIERVVDAVGEAAALSGHALAGSWEVGADWWVDLDEPEPRTAHGLEEIRSSPLWAAMVVAGSAVDEHETLPGTARSCAAAEQGDLRVEDCRALVREIERRCDAGTAGTGAVCGGADPERAAEGLTAWEDLLTARPAGNPADERRGGPAGRPDGAAAAAARLDAGALADLLEVVMDPVGSQALVAAALTADPASAARAWAQAGDPSARPERSRPLRWMAEVLGGRWRGRPDWDRVAACESVLELLLDMLHGVPAGDSDGPCAREAEAWLWVATAHLERFRGRGTRACQWLQLAEEAVAGHAGAARARRLGAASPVPVWATDPATAWHRGR